MIKNFLKTIVIIGITSTIFTGCGKNSEIELSKEFNCYQNNQLAPKWTCNPKQVGKIVVFQKVGLKNQLNKEEQRLFSVKNSKKILLTKIGSELDNSFDNLDDKKILKESKTKVKYNVLTEINQKIELLEIWRDNNNLLYTLTGINVEDINKEINNNVKIPYKSNKKYYIYQKDLSKKAISELVIEEIDNLKE